MEAYILLKICFFSSMRSVVFEKNLVPSDAKILKRVAPYRE
ncbi:hypothetical protein [uncultured Helicobacter sp.]|nr:hypothetical protein [uncultured Helicobacter sp.]